MKNNPQNKSRIRATLSRADVALVLTYDPATGALSWTDAAPQKRWAGTEAGYVEKSGYRIVAFGRVKYRAHRLAWLLMTGDWPKAGIDHRDGDRDNNRWGNLREANQSQNTANSKRWTGKALPKGVKKTPCGNFAAEIKHARKRHYLGTFPTAADAQNAYMVAAVKLFGEFARAA